MELSVRGEKDRRAGSLKSAEATAEVVIAAAEALLKTQSAGSPAKRGWLGRLTGDDPDAAADRARMALAQSHTSLGNAARDRGRLADAERHFQAALELADKLRKPDLARGVALLELGNTGVLQAKYAAAAELLRQAHPLLVKAQGDSYIPLDTYLLGVALGGAEKWDEALDVLQETESEYAGRGLDKGVLDCRQARIDQLLRAGRETEAERLANETIELADRMQLPQYGGQVRFRLASVRRKQGRMDEALQLIGEADRLYGEAGDALHQVQCLIALAEIFTGQERAAEADRQLDRATELAAKIGSPYLTADCLYVRATLRLKTGTRAEGVDLLRRAREIGAA